MEDSRGIEKEEEVLDKEIWRRYEGCEMKTKRSEGQGRPERKRSGPWREKRRNLVSEVRGVF